MTLFRSSNNDGRRILESAISRYANDLRGAGILPRDMAAHEAVAKVKELVSFGFLVPCFIASDKPCILFVPRSTTTLGGPFDPPTLLGFEYEGVRE